MQVLQVKRAFDFRFGSDGDHATSEQDSRWMQVALRACARTVEGSRSSANCALIALRAFYLTLSKSG